MGIMKSYIKFFADTADHSEIDYCFSKGVNDGITTNPRIMKNAGITNFEQACKSILERYTNIDVSLETDLREPNKTKPPHNGINLSDLDSRVDDVKLTLLQQANVLSSLSPRVVVKIPISRGGIIATEYLSKIGIKTNVTACMTPYQALEAAKAGATYVSLFANRMLDGHIVELATGSLNTISNNGNWKDIIKVEKDKFLDQAWSRTLEQIAYVAKKLDDTSSSLIVGSIRLPEDIYKIALCRPQVITIPKKIVEGLNNIPEIKKTLRTIKTNNVIIGNSLSHPMTHITLKDFEEAADSYRNIN